MSINSGRERLVALKVLWIHLPPATFWGWVFVIALGLFVCLVLWAFFGVLFESGSSRSSSAAFQRVAAQERREHQRASESIDAIYKRAEQEVRRRSSGW